RGWVLPAPGGGGGWGGGVSLPSLVACPLPVPPAEVGFIRLRPANRWPNSGKPEFGCKRGRGRCGASDGVIINTVGGHSTTMMRVGTVRQNWAPSIDRTSR